MEQKPSADIELRCGCFPKRALTDGCGPVDLRAACIMLISNIYCAAGPLECHDIQEAIK